MSVQYREAPKTAPAGLQSYQDSPHMIQDQIDFEMEGNARSTCHWLEINVNFRMLLRRAFFSSFDVIAEFTSSLRCVGHYQIPPSV